jgi:hypothetical protein
MKRRATGELRAVRKKIVLLLRARVAGAEYEKQTTEFWRELVDAAFTKERRTFPEKLANIRKRNEASHAHITVDDFSRALNLAVKTGKTGPLKDCLASDMPLSRQDRRVLAGYIEALEKRIAELEPWEVARRGRPVRD